MKTELFARIFTPTTVTDEWEAGTAYPIAKDLLITARHVLYPKQRDETQLRQVEWPECKDASGQPFSSDIASVVFDGGEEIDIAVVACKTPPELNISTKLSDRDPASDEGWDSFGYPQAGTDNQGEQEIIPGKGTFFQPNPGNHTLHLTSEGDARTKELWQGMSGAPVFHRKTRQLIAVIASTPKGFNERLYAVSIPYLLRKNQDFKKAVGFLTDAQTATSLMPPVKLGADFEKFLHQKINTEMRRPEAKFLTEQLAEHLGCNKATSDLITLIIDSLLKPPVDEAIRNYLTLAASDCIHSKGNRRYDVGDNVAVVKEIAEQILGWLVLASTNDNEIQHILPRCDLHESLFFALGVDTVRGVEIVLSRCFNHNTTKSPIHIDLPESCFKWKEEETVRKIRIEIWNIVFPSINEQKTVDDQLTATEINTLDETLRSRRIKPRNAEHYFMAFKLPERDCAFVEQVYQKLLSSLQQMTVVQFGVDYLDKLFLLPEARVTTAINEFYREING